MATSQKLSEILGAQKRCTIKRWLTIARELPEEVFAHLKDKPYLPQNLVIGNKYLVGVGADKRYRLSTDKIIFAFDLISEKIDAGLSPTANDFVEDICGTL